MTAADRAAAPGVSVVMPVYNGARFLAAAVDSILAQRFTDFELLIVDDGSTDASPAILAGYADPRIRLLRNPINLGLVPSLNIGLEAARGHYVARMDADDIAHPDRFSVQVRRLDAEPSLAFVGTGYQVIDDAGGFVKRNVQTLPPRLCRWVGLFRCPLLHPSATFRRALVQEHGVRYDHRYPVAEDFAFWSRLFELGEGAVIGRPLMSYRMHAANASTLGRHAQLRHSRDICVDNLSRAMPDVADGDVAAFVDPFHGQRPTRPDDVVPAVRLMAALLERFAARHGLSGPERRIAAGFGARWLALALLVRGRGWADPRVVAQLPVAAPTFGLPMLAEIGRAVAARFPSRPAEVWQD